MKLFINILKLFVMGNTPKASIGTKRIKKLPLLDEDVDYKHKRNDRKAKDELYNLFLDDKLIHIEKISELIDELENIDNDNKLLSKENSNYKKLLDNYKNLIYKLETQLNEQSIDKKVDNKLEKILNIEKEIKRKQEYIKENKTNSNSHCDEKIKEIQSESEEQNEDNIENKVNNTKDEDNIKKMFSSKQKKKNSEYNIDDIEQKLALIKKKLNNK